MMSYRTFITKIQNRFYHQDMMTTIKNWEVSTTPEILQNIHQSDVNITIYDRDISALKNEVENLLEKDIQFSSKGSIDAILNDIKKTIEIDEYYRIVQDIQNLLYHFKEVTNTNNFRLLLSTINTDMCRKFHTDINDLRMLCTYSGPGTLWLTEDNVNRKALKVYADNEFIVIDENNIQQAKTGSVLILKGAKYPKTGVKAAVHRSPTIEESSKKRLLLRIDTN